MLRMPVLIGALVAFIGFAAEANAQYYEFAPLPPRLSAPVPRTRSRLAASSRHL